MGVVKLFARFGTRASNRLDRRVPGASVVGTGSRGCKTLAVRESVFEGKFQAPKTQRAMRTIPLGSHAVRGLVAHQGRVTRSESSDLVFGNCRGGPLRESKVLRNVLQPTAEAAGLGKVTGISSATVTHRCSMT